jgi:hypothetical protein
MDSLLLVMRAASVRLEHFVFRLCSTFVQTDLLLFVEFDERLAVWLVCIGIFS